MLDNDRKPAEVFPPGEFIRDEMNERGLSFVEIHRQLGNDPVRCCAFDLTAYGDDRGLILDENTAADLELIFQVPAQTWINLDRAWRGKK